ncbi:MAG: ABC transporter ATP-binding protein [Lachnospiraceae bacterium]|nr:ABC transporter ATP-binding protein [Lachnospiraceae bacterium]
MEYVLTADGLCKQYGNYKVLNGLSLHVPKGAVYGLVGKNGAGKTTFIRIICGLQRPGAGDFTLYGTSGKSREIIRVRRRIGAVVETPSLYLDMSAEDNLKMQYRILGLPSFEGIGELLALVGLSGTGKKKAGHFSLGMRQRLGIAVALAGEPDFLVLDEPANGLDPQGIVEIRELILRLNRERQITVLVSSHILDELAKLATHYGFIDGGRMVQEVSADELEMACRKCIRVSVTDTSALACVLDGFGVQYRIFSEKEADIYAGINVSRLVLALEEQGCGVESIQERGESLESYYISLVGGRTRKTEPENNMSVGGIGDAATENGMSGKEHDE